MDCHTRQGAAISTVRTAYLSLALGLPFLLLVGLVGAGCNSTSITSTTSACKANSPDSPSGLTPVQQTVEYKRARELFAKQKYVAAAALLDSLLTNTERSEKEHTFLLRQKQICQQAIDGRLPAVSAIPKAKTNVSLQPRIVPTSPSIPTIASVDCGPRALLLVCQTEHVSAQLPALEHAAGTDAAKSGTSLEGLANAAKSVGFTAQGVQMDKDALANLKTPAIAWVEGNHYIAVLGINRSLLGEERDTARIHDPNHNGEEVIPLKELLSRSGGVLLTLTRNKPV